MTPAKKPKPTAPKPSSRPAAKPPPSPNRAEAQRSTLVKNVAAQAEAFQKYLPLYVQNPEFFERIRVMQTWNFLLTNAQDKMVQPAGVKQTRIQISREPLAPRPLAP